MTAHTPLINGQYSQAIHQEHEARVDPVEGVYGCFTRQAVVSPEVALPFDDKIVTSKGLENYGRSRREYLQEETTQRGGARSTGFRGNGRRPQDSTS